jgi:flagellar export protein FliJ
MAFRFPLVTVLRVRESIERREERELQRIQLEMARVSRQIEELNASIARLDQAQKQALLQPTPAGHLHTTLWEMQGAVETRKQLFTALQGLEQQRQKQMKVYQAAHRDHETMINLFKQQRDAYEMEQARAQQKYLDDIFMARRHRS